MVQFNMACIPVENDSHGACSWRRPERLSNRKQTKFGVSPVLSISSLLVHIHTLPELYQRLVSTTEERKRAVCLICLGCCWSSATKWLRVFPSLHTSPLSTGTLLQGISCWMRSSTARWGGVGDLVRWLRKLEPGEVVACLINTYKVSSLAILINGHFHIRSLILEWVVIWRKGLTMSQKEDRFQ